MSGGVYSVLAGHVDGDAPGALATVVRTEGSAPAEAAMKMAVGPDGRLAGTVGGGRVEQEVEAAAREALAGGAPRVLSFTLDDDLADEGGLLCGGTVHILVERVPARAPWVAAAAELEATGRRGAVLARIGADAVERTVLRGADAAPHVASEAPRFDGTLFVEPFVQPRCLVVGAGHVGRAVVRVARVAGFKTAVVEDRADQAERADADEVVLDELVAGLARLDATADDFVVVMTRAAGLDLACVRAGLRGPARYVGLLASRKKAARLEAELAADGVGTERLHAPIGLDLGAASAGEIAVSVVAQLIKVRRLGRGDRPPHRHPGIDP